MAASSELTDILGALPKVDTIAGRGELVGRIADLFELREGQYSDDQIAVFDTVLDRLVDRIEIDARIELANRFATSASAPPNLIEHLAMDAVIDVAGPVLSKSPRLSDGTLLACANSAGQAHLLAITRRLSLPAPLTDVLVDRGDGAVLFGVAANGGALFSERGFSTIIGKAEGDQRLASTIGMRQDLPRHHFVRLIATASTVVRDRLLATSPHGSTDIRTVVAELTRTPVDVPRDYAKAWPRINAMRASGALGDAAIRDFAMTAQVEETTVALALLCELPTVAIETALRQDRPEGILVMARAIGLSWATTRAILVLKGAGRPQSPRVLEQAAFSFERLKPETAVQALGIHRRRHQTGLIRASH